jgi:hypothetical protein
MPRSAKEYKLIPAAVPARRGGGGGVYWQVVADFAASEMDSALVDMPGRKPQALAIGLRKAAESQGAGVKVVTRAGQVYLRRV